MLPLETGPTWMQVASMLNPLPYVVGAERVLFAGTLASPAVLWGFVAAFLTAALGAVGRDPGDPDGDDLSCAGRRPVPVIAGNSCQHRRVSTATAADAPTEDANLFVETFVGHRMATAETLEHRGATSRQLVRVEQLRLAAHIAVAENDERRQVGRGHAVHDHVETPISERHLRLQLASLELGVIPHGVRQGDIECSLPDIEAFSLTGERR
jgi:hypothetical protein